MNKSIIFIATLITMVGCGSPDPCSEFISANDIYIISSYDCNESGQTELTLTARASLDDAVVEHLWLSYNWEVDGQQYEGQSVTMPANNQQSATLKVSNPGCSIEINRELDLLGRQKGYIGNKVWLDDIGPFSERGCYDSRDMSVEGILVELLDPIDSTLIDQQVTNERGLYLFENLPPGDYLVKFNNPDATKKFIDFDNCQDEDLNSDCNRQGYTEIITLEECEINLSIDAGFRGS